MLCDAYPRTAKGCAGHGLLTLRDHETPVCWSLPDAHGRGILQPSVCWRCYSDTNAPKVALEDSDEAALLEIVVGNVADPLVDRIRGGVGQICVEHDMFGTSMEGCLRCVRGNSGTVTMTPKRGRRVHRADARNTVRRGAEPRERNRFVGDPEPELSSSEAANDEVCNPIGRMVRGCLEMKGPYPVQNEFSIGGRREPRGTPGIGHLQDAEPVQAHRRINNTACAIGPRGGERGSGGGFAIDSEQWPDLGKRNCELRGAAFGMRERTSGCGSVRIATPTTTSSSTTAAHTSSSATGCMPLRTPSTRTPITVLLNGSSARTPPATETNSRGLLNNRTSTLLSIESGGAAQQWI